MIEPEDPAARYVGSPELCDAYPCAHDDEDGPVATWRSPQSPNAEGNEHFTGLRGAPHSYVFACDECKAAAVEQGHYGKWERVPR